jgi:molybdenum cofactor synthesis domain-containing protein
MHSENNIEKQANGEAIQAALLIIGDEILSGRTQDKNLAWLADYLGKLGIEFAEVRVVPDVQERIVVALNALRTAYHYVFTTGGIGPTPDDITSESVAAALGLDYGFHPQAKKILEDYYGDDITDARLRMAKMPVGATLIDNPVSLAPGFRVDNIFVLAGVPKIMQAMMMSLEPALSRGSVRKNLSFIVNLPESHVAEPMAATMKEFPNITIGSYPRMLDNNKFEVTLVLRGFDEAELENAKDWLVRRLSQLG